MPNRYFLALSALFATCAVAAESVARFTLPSRVAVQITEADFESSKFEVQGCRLDGGGCLINGRIPFGAANGLPKTYVKEIKVTTGSTSYTLDSTGMFDAWGVRPLEVPGVVRYFGGKCDDSRNCQFRGLFSDAAGAFVAEWVVVDGVSMRTVLTSSGDIRNAIRSNIDPEEYE